MLDDTEFRIMELAGKGYCCSQIMLLLALDQTDHENSDLIRAATGLCNGLGDCSGPCGVYLGAVLFLGLYSGKGTDIEEADNKLPIMLEELHEWFTDTTKQYGGSTCNDILDGNCGRPDPIRCGGLLSISYVKVIEILLSNGLNPAERRDLL